MRPAIFLPKVLLAGIIAVSPLAQAAFPTVALKAVCSQQIHSPTTITYAPDGSGRLFVCDEPGKIYIIQGGMLLPTPFLNIASTGNAPPNNGPGPVVTEGVGYNERGLLGLAFHPGYANPASPGYRKFYVLYNKNYISGTDPAPFHAGDPVTSVTVIAEYQVSTGNPNVADSASERRLLLFTRPQNNHNGGQLEFGPDGFLYIGSGDGGSQMDNDAGHTGGSSSRPTDNLGNGQDRRVLLAKILRIDPLGTNGPGGQYGIPASNPFVGQTQSIAGHPEFDGPMREEIYSYGMRNPWRFSFDKRPGGTNRMFCGDVGGDRIEEIDIIVSGGNYGWRYKEGTEFPTFSSGAATNPMPDYVGGTIIDPIAVYAHSNLPASDPTTLPKLGLSVTGGFVYRGTAIPALQGKYVFGDYGSTSGASDGRIMGLEETAPLSGVFTLTQAIPFINSTNPVSGQRILCLGEDESGEIYVGMKTKAGVLALDGGFPSGGIYKIVPLQVSNVTLAPSKDNTIFSEDTTPTAITNYWPYTSDGQGYLYAGKTGPNYGPYVRRALVAFDVAAQVPAGSIIQSAQLRLQPIKIAQFAPGKTISLKRLTETWGEGASSNSIDQGYGAAATTGDATWTRRSYNTSSWSTAGGTYIGTDSATAVVPISPATMMIWGSTTQLVTDVQGWVNTPSSNAGWILIGNEGVNQTACQFASLQKGATPPALQVTYGVAPSATHFESWLVANFPTNHVGQFVDPAGDNDGDGIANLIEYAYGFSPVAADPPNSGLQVSSAAVDTDTVVTILFRRDPLATDLTYELQTSSDLVAWNSITTSVAGAAASGPGFVSESGSPIMLVTAQETLPAPANRFVRLRITRAP